MGVGRGSSASIPDVVGFRSKRAPVHRFIIEGERCDAIKAGFLQRARQSVSLSRFGGLTSSNS